jgi:hypothetical protein
MYATAVLSDHPVAFYQFGDRVGSASFADSSGNGNTAMSNGSDHIVAPGPFGESTQALSIGNDGAQAPQLAPMQGDNSRTVELWFNTTRTDDQCVLTAGSASHAQSFSLCLTDGQQYHAPPPNTPGVYLQTWDADVYIPNLALTDGKWHYLAVALSGSTVTINVDGSAPSGGFVWSGFAYSGFTTQPFTLPTQPDTASTPVGIGSKGWAAAFVGEIADVAIYPAALTEEQIAAHHSSGPTPTEPVSRKIALPAPAFPPVSTIPPDVSGEPIQGETLAEHHGTWLDSPNTFSYQWERCDGSGDGCATIPGATQPTYALTASDIGHMVTVQEIASNAGGAGSAATSKATGPVLPALHPNARLHARILAAAGRLAHHRGATVQLTVTLNGAIAESAGVSPGTQLSGIGVVDFARRRARWSLPLPASLGGGTLNAIVGPSGAYVQLGQVTSTAVGKWIHVGLAQLTEIPRFGFVGALALLLNPDGAVALLKSTTREVAQVGRAVASVSGVPGVPFRTPHAAAASVCSATPGIDSVQTALDPSKLVGVVRDTKDTLHEIHSTTSQIRMIAGLGPTGALGAIQMVDQEGLTISGRYCSTKHPADGATPPAVSLTSARSWFTLDPCLVGRWILAGPLLGPSSYPIAAGQTALEISPTGEASLTYVEHTFPYAPLPKETFYGLPDPLGGPDAVGVFGSALLTVAAPLATKDTAHRIVWSIINDQVHQIFAGTIIEGSEIPGYEVFYPPPLEPVIVEPIVTPPFDIPPIDSPVGPSGVVVSDYECNPEDPIFKTGTLKTTQPIGNKVELKFLRVTPIYDPPAD